MSSLFLQRAAWRLAAWLLFLLGLLGGGWGGCVPPPRGPKISGYASGNAVTKQQTTANNLASPQTTTNNGTPPIITPLLVNARYDGQVWVKTPEVLARDRLAVMYSIRPAMARLKAALLGLGGALAASVVLLAALPPPEAQSYAPPAPYAPSPAAPAAAAAIEYEERLRRFEPWALEDGGADGGAAAAAARPSVADHMRAAAAP